MKKILLSLVFAFCGAAIAQPFSYATNDTTPQPFTLEVKRDTSGTADALFATTTGSGNGYPVHGISYALHGSGGGFAAYGLGSGVVGNKRGSGPGAAGNGVYGTRLDDADGNGVVGNKTGAGNGDAVLGVEVGAGISDAGKFNKSGTGTGHGVTAINSSSADGHALTATRIVQGTTRSAAQLGFYEVATAQHVGVYAYAPKGTNSWAGRFEGDVRISGKIVMPGLPFSTAPATDAASAIALVNKLRDALVLAGLVY